MDKPLHHLAEAFLASRSARRLSERTLVGYRQQLARFLGDDHHLPERPEDVEAFLAGLAVSRNTQRNYHRTLAAFYKWVEQRAGIPNPMALIEAPRRERTIKPRPTAEHVARMLNAATSIRDRIMLTILYDTGCRVGELVHIRAEDVHGDLLRIPRGKTGERWVPLPPDLPGLIERAGITRGVLITNIRTGQPLTVIGAERAYKRLARAAGLPEELQAPHSARRYAATRTNNASGITAAMALLGHRDVRTTMEYIDASVDMLLPTWRSKRPLAGIVSISEAHAARSNRVRLRFRFELFPNMSVRELARIIGVSHQQVHGARAGYWELFEELDDHHPIATAA